MASKLQRSEKGLESWLVKYVKSLGGECFKLTFIVGIPDRLILLPGGRILFLELKTPVGRASALQLWWANRLDTLGFDVAFVSTRDEIKKLVA